MIAGARKNYLRVRTPHEHSRVHFVELFFDLVFVFAITQISHTLLEHFTLAGLAHAAMMLAMVWWSWIFTCWVTNWTDPQTLPVRIMMFVMMFAGLVMSVSIPEAFGATGIIFAGAYVFMHLLRTGFMLWVLRHHNRANFRNFQRIIVWLAGSTIFWIAGGLAEEAGLRFALWIAALAIEFTGPAARFFVPGMGRSTTADWDVEGAHMAERCGLFLIIVLGESILVTGATFSGLEWSGPTVAAFSMAFLGTVAMWWIYFNIGQERASAMIAESDDPGSMARLAYTYLHLPLVAGLIVVATADEQILAHPKGHVAAGTIAAVLGGPALYLAGNILFKRTVWNRLPLSHLVGLALLLLLVPIAPHGTPVTLGAAATIVLVIVAVWETISLRARGLTTLTL